MTDQTHISKVYGWANLEDSLLSEQTVSICVVLLLRISGDILIAFKCAMSYRVFPFLFYFPNV